MPDVHAEPEFASGPPPWVAEEESVLARTLPLLRALQDADRAQDAEWRDRMAEHHRQWTDAQRERVQREALEEALEADALHLRAHRAARRSRELPLGPPYFGRMVLEEGRRRVEVMLGKVGVTDGGLRIVDWRHAPVSRLFYEYEEGEEFAEEIADREREGTVAVRRRLDIRDGLLVEAQRGDEALRRTPTGDFVPPDVANARAERQELGLPDIVSLITREQFGVIARPDAGVVLLRGRAGSGKTTVALHRIAWLHYQDPARFSAERTLIVMFNKALQTYISKVLPDLGVRGVRAETFHGWALRLLRQGGVDRPFRGDLPPAVARLKRHPAMDALVAESVDALGDKLAGWVAERLPEGAAGVAEGLVGSGYAKLALLRERSKKAGFGAAVEPDLRAAGRRLTDHARDLWALFDDDARCRRLLPAELHRALPAAREHAARCQAEGWFTYEDAALLLRLGQRKAAAVPDLGCPWAGRYAHVVIDEAQDLSTLEIASLVDAADDGRSVTIAGDPAQKILADAQFEGFEALLSRLAGEGRISVRLDALQVGHRSTRPIMALALAALGRAGDADLAVAAARDGDPVCWLDPDGDAADEGAWHRAAAAELVAFRGPRPMSLVAVLCKRKDEADRWAKGLAAAGAADVRRAERQEFQFTPGVVVSNVHQVKGLEFDGVLLVDPAAYGPRDRHLLHVAITRAADRLWVAAPHGPGGLPREDPG